MILNMIPMYIRNKYNLKQNHRKIYRSVSLSYGIVYFSKSHIFVFCAFNKLCQKQTLIDRKYLSPYLNSIPPPPPLIFYRHWSKSSSFYHLSRQFLWRLYRDLNKLISAFHILIAGQHLNNRVTEEDERLNEIRHTY